MVNAPVAPGRMRRAAPRDFNLALTLTGYKYTHELAYLLETQALTPVEGPRHHDEKHRSPDCVHQSVLGRAHLQSDAVGILSQRQHPRSSRHQRRRTRNTVG